MPEDLLALAIRASSPDDEAFVQELSTRVFSPYSRDPRRAIRSILEDRGSETLIAEIGALRAGFVVLQYEPLPRDFGPWVRPVAARVNAIAVRSDLQGRGVGLRLLAAAEKAARARGARSLSLATAERNARARRLFARGGFVELARVERYYAGGQAALLIHKALLG